MPTADRQWVIQNTSVAIALFVEAVKNRDNIKVADTIDIFRLTIDYSLSLEQMITTALYDWKNDNITAERFPIEETDTAEYEARYFHFNNCGISSENAIKEIEQAGWLPAKIEHVLAYGKTFPEEQLRFPIVGLGSVAEVGGNHRVPYLYRIGFKRHLALSWFGFGWCADYRFLAVRKVSGN